MISSGHDIKTISNHAIFLASNHAIFLKSVPQSQIADILLMILLFLTANNHLILISSSLAIK